jgi:CBS domain containing-hemolysin-like protein
MLERDEEGMIRAVFELNDKTARDLMRDVLTIPENRLIDEILEDLRRQDLQMAVVIDEWGSFEGLFTLEDIVEEIVGERSGTSSTTRSQPAKSCATAPTAWTGASR